MQDLYEALSVYTKDQSTENNNQYNKAHDHLKIALISIFREAWGKIKTLQ